MTSSGLEWDYYEFQPVESSSVEYATPGADSFLLPANADNSYWDPRAISEWSMSAHTAHTSEIVQEKIVPVKEIKDEKNKRNQKRRARKEPRRSEREKEVRALVHRRCAAPVPVHAVTPGAALQPGRAPRAAWLHGCLMLRALHPASCPACTLGNIKCRENKLISNKGPRTSFLEAPA